MKSSALCIWVTRSEPGASRLAQALAHQGWNTLREPVLEIQPLASPGPVEQVDIQIFLSEHAVRLVDAQWFAYPCMRFAVGAGTAAALANLGVSARIPESSGSEGLLELPELSKVQGQRIALIAGLGGRDLLLDTLRTRGAQVLPLAVYERKPKQQAAADLTPVTAIVVSSGDGFRAASRLWFAVKQLGDVPVFTPSARVADLAPGLGFTLAINCQGADPANVVKQINAWQTQQISRTGYK